MSESQYHTTMVVKVGICSSAISAYVVALDMSALCSQRVDPLKMHYLAKGLENYKKFKFSNRFSNFRELHLCAILPSVIRIV